MIGKVLVEAKPQVTKTAPYIPVFYQVIPSVTCPKDTEVSVNIYNCMYLYTSICMYITVLSCCIVDSIYVVYMYMFTCNFDLFTLFSHYNYYKGVTF